MSKAKEKPIFGDIDLWDQIKATTKPLKKKKYIAQDIFNKDKPWEQSTGLPPFPLTAFTKKQSILLKQYNKELSSGDLTQMDGRNAERFRKGRLHFDGRIDLHGFTSNQAWEALRSFLLFSYNQNRRCVLVITGKGWKNRTGKGVLRSNISKWLNASEIRPFILGFSRAQDKDGGDGAFYVMLKRKHRK